MTIQNILRISRVALATTLLIGGGIVQAQPADLVDVSRDEVQLRADMADAIDRNVAVANTALVFNNASPRDTLVVCVAYDANGDVLGRKAAKVPARGVRYLRASDLSDGADFVGSAICRARGYVVSSAVFLAPGAITKLDVVTRKGKRSTRARFPLIATY